MKDAFADVIESWSDRFEHLRAYSTAGVRPDCDFFLWKITERYADLGELGAALNGTPLAGWLETPYSYLATTKASPYTEARRPRKIIPKGSPYLVVYPFVKVRPWYALPLEDRKRAMDEHIRDRPRVRDDPQPHDLLVRDRRPGVHDRVRVRRAVRLHAPDADPARERGLGLHRARHADLRRRGNVDPGRARRARRRVRAVRIRCAPDASRRSAPGPARARSRWRVVAATRPLLRKPARPSSTERPSDVKELANVLQLRSDFEADAGKTRAIVLLSPT